MFDGSFFFSGRIGRLRFFLNSLAAFPAAAIAALFAALMPMPWHGKAVLFVLFAIAFAWFSLSLQVRRIRDIGWDPFIVIVGAIALACCDVIFAHFVPSMSKDGFSTPIGSVASGGLTLILLFWPGEAFAHIPDQVQPYRFGR